MFFFISQNKFVFTIKDPVFLSQNNPDFTFFFGNLNVRALVECTSEESSGLIVNGKNLCALESTRSKSELAGIKAKSKTSPKQIDTSMN